MKSALMAIALLGFSGAALADVVTPNTYECRNKSQKIEVVYTETSFTGAPTFKVKSGGQTLSLLDGLKLEETTQSPIGQIVSAFDTYIMDASLNYSLIIPSIILDNNLAPVEFTTKFVTTFKAGMIRPSFAGAIQSNKMVDVKCTASKRIY